MVFGVVLSFLIAAPGMVQDQSPNQAALFPPSVGSRVTLSTKGYCSPVVADVVGNVTIVCNGVSPQALKKLNLELDEAKLDAQQKLEEANKWAMRYFSLKQQLEEEGIQDELTRQALQMIEAGRLDEADALLLCR